MANCERFLELLSVGLDGELTQEEEQELAEHLAFCPTCRARGAQLTAIHAAFPAVEEVSAPEGFAKGVMARIRAEESAKPKVIPLFRRPQVKALAGLAACFVLCLGVYQTGLLNLGAEKDAAEAAAMAPQTPMTIQESSKESAVFSAAGGKKELTAADSVQAEVPGAPGHYAFANDQYIRVSFGQTPEAPSARVLGSTGSLEEFLAQFPADDLSAVADHYGEDYFNGHKLLLAIVLEEGSDSVRHSIVPQGLLREQVTVVRQVPEVGTCDMAAWLILAEVDTMFRDGDILSVVTIEE